MTIVMSATAISSQIIVECINRSIIYKSIHKLIMLSFILLFNQSTAIILC